MSRRLIILGLSAAFVTPSLAHAQDRVAGIVESGEQDRIVRRVEERPAQGGRGGRIVAAVETKTTTGRPYSAEAVTEMTQALGDGNSIQNRSATKVYRDGEGRTRREILADDGSVRSISISDSVARTNFTLDPVKKIAYQSGGNVVLPRTAEGTYTVLGRGGRSTTATIAQPVERQAAERGGTTAVRGGTAGSVPLMRTPAPDDPNVKKEDLGVQNIEGVSATGTRTTRVIPAGEIGNAKEIRIVSEQWFSDELQVLVMTRHSDPRNGETVYRLRNILRAEPDPMLFTVPTDYTVQQGRILRRQ